MQALFKRKYRSLVLLVIVAVLFYLIQCLTVSKLGHLSRGKARAWVPGGQHQGSSVYTDDDGDDDILLRGRKRIVDGESHMHQGMDNSHLSEISELKFKEWDRDMKQSVDENKKISELDLSEKEKNLDKVYLNDLPEIGIADGNKKSDVKYASDIKRSDSMDIGDGFIDLDLRGVHEMDKRKYRVDTDGLFACLKDNKVKIQPHQVNDDFCDCPDGSDEPGTSACPNTSFYCGQQIKAVPPQFISSSKVNDGICDCCDGSDEWAGTLLPESIRIKAGEKLGAVYHAPCTNKCQAIIATQLREQQLRERGQKLQKEYIKQAQRALSASKLKEFGPDGVFYPLSKQCFSLRETHYTYQVCPFSRVEQKAGPHVPTIIGRNSQSLTKDKGEFLLVMDNGDTKLCPFGKSRRAKIYLLCDVEETLVKVIESELCEYTFTLTTPAAC